MKLPTIVPVFLSGFIVYGVVATAVGAGGASGSPDVGAIEALTDPVPRAKADSGSRLKAQYLLGDDGSKDYQSTFTSWISPLNGTNVHTMNTYFDSQRQEQCAFAPAADGAMRCLPTDWIYEYSALYSDAACLQHVIPVPAPSGGCMLVVPKYTQTLDTSGAFCPITNGYYPSHYFPVMQFVGPNLSQCYAKQNNVCVPASCPSGNAAGYAYYAVGAEVPAASFVGSTPQIDP